MPYIKINEIECDDVVLLSGASTEELEEDFEW